MDMITIDVTDVPTVNRDDKVELWGQHIPIQEVAEHVDIIPNELMTCVSKRVPRVFR